MKKIIINSLSDVFISSLIKINTLSDIFIFSLVKMNNLSDIDRPQLDSDHKH